MDEEAPAIGIDLGTTFSCVAVLENDKIKVIHGDDGNYTMASCVLFKDTGEQVVGNSAKEMFIKNINICAIGVKRLIGRTFQEYETLKKQILFQFPVKNKNGKPVIVVTDDKEEQYFTAEEISGIILRKIKEQTEEVLGKKVSKAVITVPAHFNGSQRQATMNAGRLAGLEVLRIINEPTAAALAYDIDSKYEEKKCNILVYDFGGGTFDVSIVTMFRRALEVQATNGEPFLGGDDIDARLTNLFIQEFNHENNVDVSKETLVIRRIMQKAENVKKQLSNTMSVNIELDYLYKNKHFSTTLTRPKFINLNKDLFTKTLTCVTKTLKDANMSKEDIDEIILIGGTTRIPYVRDMVKHYFNKEPNASVHPDQAVAIGAAKRAALSQNSKSDIVECIKLSDVCSLSLGIECKGDIMDVIIPRNAKLPATIVHTYTLDPEQTKVRITIYEGERTFIHDNIKLGEIILTGLSNKGNATIKVSFNLDEDGILHIVAEEQNGSQKNEVDVDMLKNQLSEDEIQEMLRKAEIYKNEDKKRKKIALARIDLESFCYDIQKILMEHENCAQEKKRKEILDKLEKVENWVRDTKELTLEQINKKRLEVYDFSKSLLDSL